MRVKTGQFCTLATSPSWQAWLYHHHVGIYRRFIHELQESRGCGQNREIMSTVLSEICDAHGEDDLVEFLQKHYPNMIDGPSIDQQRLYENQVLEHDGVFQYYNPNVLTYPRRQIFVGPKSMLRNKVQEFLLDKLRGDHIIIKDRAYIEYLEQGDAGIADKVPIHNWQIAAYRQK